MTREEELLLEQVTSAHRERGADGAIRAHSAWFDLPDAARNEAFEATLVLRDFETALAGQSTTVSAVLAKIRTSRGA